MVAGVHNRSDVVDAITRSADPTAARMLLTRISEAQPALAAAIAGQPLFRDAVIAIAGASRSLSNGLLADPAMLIDLDPSALAIERDHRVLRTALVGMGGDDPDTQLRRWKRRELFRIAVRDLLGLASMPTVGRELSALAEVALERAVDLAEPEVPFAVIGMGKLGGRELNYASDVDVMFVHAGDALLGEQAARRVLATMSAPTDAGIVFRTDANLRPEGRSGILSRGVDGFRNYYERWAQPWELQALIKARPVAGDDDLGAAFTEMTQPFLWPSILRPDAIREIRAMKARTEDLLAKKGVAERELKRGPGGIRDIEFAVQLLQLVHGRADESIRSPNTLDALASLAEHGYVIEADAVELDAAYQFLRTVEHRLQLHDEQQTHTLPADTESRAHLARVLGYRSVASASALEQFDRDQRDRQRIVRAHHESMFFAPLLDALAGRGAMPESALEDRLHAFGFTDARQTRAALAELTQGLTRRSRVMTQLLPVLLEWLSESPDPDLGLLALRRLAEGEQRSMELSTQFRESPLAAQRTCRVLGSSRIVGDALRREPRFVETLGEPAALATPISREEIIGEALTTVAWRGADTDGRRDGLRRFYRRHFLRIASRDLLGLASIEEVEREFSAVAEGALEAALRATDLDFPFAVIGLGRFGGAELSYASDLDILFVFQGDGTDRVQIAERAATTILRDLGATTDEGRTFAVDPTLRPEGRMGALARSLTGYRRYYEEWAQPWERQALLRARPVAGDAALGDAFMEMITPLVFQPGGVDDTTREIRRMKARVERERIPPGEDPQFHLKLGPGALSDVEWTAQLLQLQHAGHDPSLRTSSTVEALTRLTAAGFLTDVDASVLEAAYRYCERARNLGYLLAGAPADSLPIDGPAAERLGVLMGYVQRPQAALRDDYRRVTRRSRRVFERVFYGSDHTST